MPPRDETSLAVPVISAQTKRSPARISRLPVRLSTPASVTGRRSRTLGRGLLSLSQRRHPPSITGNGSSTQRGQGDHRLREFGQALFTLSYSGAYRVLPRVRDADMNLILWTYADWMNQVLDIHLVL